VYLDYCAISRTLQSVTGTRKVYVGEKSVLLKGLLFDILKNET